MRHRGPFSWVKMGLLWVGLFLLIYALVALEARTKGWQGPQRPTTYSSGPGGYKALYLWLREMGVPVQRWERPSARLEEGVSVLLMVEPEYGPDRGELKALGGWVRRGGTLVLAMRPPQIFLEHFGFKPGIQGALEDKKPVTGAIRVQPGPYTPGIASLLTEPRAGLTSDRPEVVVHLRDPWGGLVAAVREGKGRVIALSDPSLFTNGALRKGDHARLALNLLLAHLDKGTLSVDEYHHGYGRATSVAGHLFGSMALAPMVQAGILLLILWGAAGRRFGPARARVKREEHSSMEYVRAMARVLHRAGARQLALGTIARWTEDEARRLLLEGDETLRKRVQGAKNPIHGQGLSDRGLVLRVRDLHRALERATHRNRDHVEESRNG